MIIGAEGRSMLLGVYKTKTGRWLFLRITNPVTNSRTETPITAAKFEELIMMGVPELPIGGGL